MGVALIVRRMPGRFSALMLIVLSLTVSCRYIWWRYTSTLNWDDPVSWCAGLFCCSPKRTRGLCWCSAISGRMASESSAGAIAERYVAVAVGGYLCPDLQRRSQRGENTIYASLGIDWPKDKLNIWILDDGGREEFRQFAQNVG